MTCKRFEIQLWAIFIVTLSNFYWLAITSQEVATILSDTMYYFLQVPGHYWKAKSAGSTHSFAVRLVVDPAVESDLQARISCICLAGMSRGLLSRLVPFGNTAWDTLMGKPHLISSFPLDILSLLSIWPLILALRKYRESAARLTLKFGRFGDKSTIYLHKHKTRTTRPCICYVNSAAERDKKINRTFLYSWLRRSPRNIQHGRR